MLQWPVWLVPLWLGLHTGCAQLAVVYNELWESQPGIMALDLVKGLGLAEMSGQGVIMSILEDAQLQHSNIWDIYAVVLPEKSVGTGSPLEISLVREMH